MNTLIACACGGILETIILIVVGLITGGGVKWTNWYNARQRLQHCVKTQAKAPTARDT